MPNRRHTFILAAGIVVALVAAGCGNQQQAADDLPPMPPTITPVLEATPAVTPTPELEGEILEPLDDGQEVAPDDQRYALMMPSFWVPGSAPGTDIAYRESGGSPVDHGYAYNVMHERLPATVTSAEEYAESGFQAVEDSFADVEMLSLEPVQIGGVQAARLVYTVTITSDSVMVHQVYLVDGRTGYLLTGSAPADGDLEAAHALFDSIAASFTLPRG